MVVIVDYRMGNLGSIQNMLRKAGTESEITSDPRRFLQADHLILPGVGRFDRAMQNLREMNLIPGLEEAVLEKKIPTLGICLGMQIMTEGSEEGGETGLGWFPGLVKKFRPDPERKLTVPHMGWNDLQVQKPHFLLSGLEQDSRFYFVHSYYVHLKNRGEILAETDYALPFVSALGRDHILGTQFHPEKSHRFGLSLLKNFVNGRPS
jgi:glutamine amidotransferase